MKVTSELSCGAFSIAALKLLNNLPLCVRQVPSLPIFERHLKAQLFSLAFTKVWDFDPAFIVSVSCVIAFIVCLTFSYTCLNMMYRTLWQRRLLLICFRNKMIIKNSGCPHSKMLAVQKLAINVRLKHKLLSVLTNCESVKAFAQQGHFLQVLIMFQLQESTRPSSSLWIHKTL